MIYFISGTNDMSRRKKMYEYIDSVGGQCYLIVPDQFSFESEKMLSDFLTEDKNSNRVEALSFSRLCNYIFREYGGLAGEYIDDATKAMIMGASLYNCADRLSYYNKNIHGTSFINKLLSTDSELKNAGVTADNLKSVSESSENPSLSLKSHDLFTIFSEYNSILEKSWVDPLTDISRACDILKEHNFFESRTVFFDGFTGFTAIEYKIIEHILTQAQSVFFSLCSDDLSSLGSGSLFSESVKTAARIRRLCEKRNLKVGETIRTDLSESEKVGSLNDIEHGFLRNHYSPKFTNSGEVEVVSASDPYDEANYVAAKVRELAEKGMRWNDIAIIARDLSIYEHALPDAFSRLGIPLFIDRNANVSSHPLSAFLTAALSACRNSMDPMDIMRMLKTGILPLSEEDIAEFENYCFIWNIRGRMFASEFKNNPRGFEESKEDYSASLSRINYVRELALVPLCELHEKLLNADGREFSAAVYDFIKKCNIKEGLRNLYDMYAKSGDIAMAESLDSYWTYIISLLDKFTASLSGIRLGERTMTKLFETVLTSAKIGILPQTVDCVCAGTADRSRTYNPKAVFVMGCNDGIFPARPSGTGLFTEKERAEMINLGLELSGSDNDFILSERMFAFYTFSSASQYLSVSWFKYSHTSELQQKSVFISNLNESVKPLPVIKTSDIPETFWLCNDETAFDRLSQCGNDSTPKSEALKSYFLSSPLWKEKALKMGHTLDTSKISIINKNTAERLFGTDIRLSPSSIESFETCPFRFYLQYGLRLKERRKAELSPISKGTLIHYVLEKIIPKHTAKGLYDLSDDELKCSIEEIMNEYLDSVMGSDDDKSARFKYLFGRIKGFLFKLIRHLGEEFHQSQFEPYDFELSVGEDSDVPAYRLETIDGGAVSVVGKIDRVDTLSKNGSKYVRVVDYKTGPKDFRLCDVYYGINIQMLVYLFSIWSGGKGELENTVPAGVLYMPARDGVTSLDRNKLSSDEEVRNAQNKRFATNGLLLDDRSVLIAMESDLGGVFIPYKDGGRNAAESLASIENLGKIKKHIDSLLISLFTELSNGKIGAKPYKKSDENSCDICPYVSICRRDKNAKFEEHRTFANSEFYTIIEEGDSNA